MDQLKPQPIPEQGRLRTSDGYLDAKVLPDADRAVTRCSLVPDRAPEVSTVHLRPRLSDLTAAVKKSSTTPSPPLRIDEA